MYQSIRYRRRSNSKINTYGNTTGNIANGGIAAIQGDWIYCTKKVFGDDMYRMGRDTLYKLRTDGTDFQLVK